jgi:plasmid stabilization system protein ParE
MPRLISDCLTLRQAPTLRKASVRGSMTLLTDALVRRERSSTIFAANMTYLVELTARAARDLETLYREMNAAESGAAARWYNGLEQTVYARARFPQRCPIAPEARKAKRNLRHLLYGKSLTSIGPSINSMNAARPYGCSQFATVPGGN